MHARTALQYVLFDYSQINSYHAFGIIATTRCVMKKEKPDMKAKLLTKTYCLLFI